MIECKVLSALSHLPGFKPLVLLLNNLRRQSPYRLNLSSSKYMRSWRGTTIIKNEWLQTDAELTAHIYNRYPEQNWLQLEEFYSSCFMLAKEAILDFGGPNLTRLD